MSMSRDARPGRKRSWMGLSGSRTWWDKRACAGGTANSIRTCYRVTGYNRTEKQEPRPDTGTGASHYMALTNETIKERLIAKFGDQLSHFEEPYGLLTFEAPRDLNLKVMQFLYDDEELRFQFL